MSKITRRALLASTAVVAVIDAAHGAISISPVAQSTGGGGGATITSVSLSNNSFIGGSGSGTVVGTISVAVSSGSFAGTLTLSGTDAAKFQIVGSQLQLATTVANGTYSINIIATDATFSNSPFTQPETITGGAAASYSITFANTSGSASPSTTPIQTGQAFKQGDVVSGNIAVPQIGGSDIPYQTDNRIFWSDGSLAFCVYRMLAGVISGGGTQQITFNIRSGSWNNTSSNTVADVTGNSDYKLALTNVHTAQIGAAGSSGISGFLNAEGAVSLTIGGGAVTGGTVFFYDAGHATLPTSTFSISNGGGSGAQGHIDGSGNLVITAGGTGYANVGTGSFTIGFNDGVTIVNGSGNHNGASLVQYAKGPVCDAWRVRVPVSGMKHYHVAFHVERWKDGGGSFLAFKAAAIANNGLVDTVNAMPNYTYSVDWKNGSTVIRGTTNSDGGFTNLQHFIGGAFGTFNTAAQMDWSTNNTAYNAILQKRTPTECDQIKSTGVILPWLNIAPTVTVPTTPVTYEVGSNGGLAFKCVYNPLGSAGIRSPLGSGGGGNQEDPMSQINALHWMALRSSTAGWDTWLLNGRVGAANSLGTAQLGGAVLDPTTFYLPNVVPTSAQTFSGMTPTLENHYVGDITMTGYIHTVIEGGGDLTSIGNPYHQICATVYPYIVEGEQWMLDTLTNATGSVIYSVSYAFHRQATVGATTYYGIMANVSNNVRIAAWMTRTTGYAGWFMPASWSDGTTNIEQQYVQFCLKQEFDYLGALFPYTGSNVVWGTSGSPIAKPNDFTGSGVQPELIATQCEVTIPFMDDYWMQVTAHLAFLYSGTSVGTPMVTWRDYFKNYYVKLWAYSGNHFLNDSFRLQALATAPPSGPADATWSSTGNVSSPGVGIYTNLATPILTFTNGNSTIVLNNALILYGSTAVANGSRIKLTTSGIDQQAANNATIPTPFDATTWYYWKSTGGTNCQLFAASDPGMTTPLVPTQSSSNVNGWLCPANTLPADNSGSGTVNGGQVTGGDSRIGVKLGTLRLCQAMGMADDSNGNVTNAITNTATIFNAVPGQTGFDSSQYGWDNTL